MLRYRQRFNLSPDTTLDKPVYRRPYGRRLRGRTAHLFRRYIQKLPAVPSGSVRPGHGRLYSGWNFVGIDNGALLNSPFDTNLKDIKGDCNIERSYFYNEYMQEWEEAPVEYAQLEEDSPGHGWLVKVSSDCTLGEVSEGDGTAPPSLPGNNAICTDTDSGLDYNVFGVVSFNGLGDIPLTDYEDACMEFVDEYTSYPKDPCSGENCTLQEYYCTEDLNLNTDQYTCPNGCQDGACL